MQTSGSIVELTKLGDATSVSGLQVGTGWRSGAPVVDAARGGQSDSVSHLRSAWTIAKRSFSGTDSLFHALKGTRIVGDRTKDRTASWYEGPKDSMIPVPKSPPSVVECECRFLEGHLEVGLEPTARRQQSRRV
jgi:hypothetical protein